MKAMYAFIPKNLFTKGKAICYTDLTKNEPGHFMKKRITKDMFIQEIIHEYPETIHVFKEHNLECMNCQIAEFEDIGHGAKVHHLDPEKLVEELNIIVENKEEESP